MEWEILSDIPLANGKEMEVLCWEVTKDLLFSVCVALLIMILCPREQAAGSKLTPPLLTLHCSLLLQSLAVLKLGDRRVASGSCILISAYALVVAWGELLELTMLLTFLMASCCNIVQAV